MAYTAVVEKLNVSKTGNGIYSASIKMTVNDGQSDVFETTVSALYNQNAPSLDNVKADLLAKLKDAWDKWADENGIYTAAAFTTMISEIQTSANAYVNQ